MIRWLNALCKWYFAFWTLKIIRYFQVINKSGTNGTKVMSTAVDSHGILDQIGTNGADKKVLDNILTGNNEVKVNSHFSTKNANF